MPVKQTNRSGTSQQAGVGGETTTSSNTSPGETKTFSNFPRSGVETGGAFDAVRVRVGTGRSTVAGYFEALEHFRQHQHQQEIDKILDREKAAGSECPVGFAAEFEEMIADLHRRPACRKENQERERHHHERAGRAQSASAAGKIGRAHV